MIRILARILVPLAPLLLAVAACGQLPQPFFGNPGASATRLAQPPPSRLAVPSPSQSLLSDEAAEAWAESIAAALAAQEVPASHVRARAGDWTLVLSAELRGPDVVPSYTVRNPAGEAQGTSQGTPIPAQEWASGNPATLKTAATQAAPSIADLLTRIEAARLQSDPNSLMNRPARVYLTGVSGAPGDGNRSLQAQIRTKLAEKGVVVQDTAASADFSLRGEVQTAPGANGTTRVEVQWIVDDANGERGRILQMNEVPGSTIASYWGDVAAAVASEAAGGVKEVLTNASGPRLGPK